MPSSDSSPPDLGTDIAALAQKVVDVGNDYAKAQDEADILRDEFVYLAEQLGAQQPGSGFVSAAVAEAQQPAIKLSITARGVRLSRGGVHAELTKQMQNVFRVLAAKRDGAGGFAPVAMHDLMRRLAALEGRETPAIGTCRMRIARLRQFLKEGGYGRLIQTTKVHGHAAYRLVVPV